MMKRKKQSENYLDLIPERAPELSWDSDGQRTVMELADLQKEQFGDEAEPVYPRVVRYMQIMESYHFIRFVQGQYNKE